MFVSSVELGTPGSTSRCLVWSTQYSNGATSRPYRRFIKPTTSAATRHFAVLSALSNGMTRKFRPGVIEAASSEKRTIDEGVVGKKVKYSLEKVTWGADGKKWEDAVNVELA